MSYNETGQLSDPAYRRERARRAAVASHDPRRMLSRIDDPVELAQLAVVAATRARTLAAGTPMRRYVLQELAKICEL